MLHVVCCMLCAACCVLHVVCCMLCAACCVLHVVCCMLSVACCTHRTSHVFCACCCACCMFATARRMLRRGVAALLETGGRRGRRRAVGCRPLELRPARPCVARGCAECGRAVARASPALSDQTALIPRHGNSLAVAKALLTHSSAAPTDGTASTVASTLGCQYHV